MRGASIRGAAALGRSMRGVESGRSMRAGAAGRSMPADRDGRSTCLEGATRVCAAAPDIGCPLWTVSLSALRYVGRVGSVVPDDRVSESGIVLVRAGMVATVPLPT